MPGAKVSRKLEFKQLAYYVEKNNAAAMHFEYLFPAFYTTSL